MGNAGLCPRDGTVSLCSLQMPRALLEANYKKAKAPSHRTPLSFSNWRKLGAGAQGVSGAVKTDGGVCGER